MCHFFCVCLFGRFTEITPLFWASIIFHATQVWQINCAIETGTKYYAFCLSISVPQLFSFELQENPWERGWFSRDIFLPHILIQRILTNYNLRPSEFNWVKFKQVKLIYIYKVLHIHKIYKATDIRDAIKKWRNCIRDSRKKVFQSPVERRILNVQQFAAIYEPLLTCRQQSHQRKNSCHVPPGI